MTSLLASAYRAFLDNTEAHGLAPITLELYRIDIKRFIEFVGEATPIDKVTLQDFLDFVQSFDLELSATRRAFYAIRFFLNFCGVEPFGEYQPQIGSWEWKIPPAKPHEIDAILDIRMAQTYEQQRTSIACNLVYCHALPREVVWLTTSDVFPNSQLMILPRGYFPLDGRATVALRHWLRVRWQKGGNTLLLTSKRGEVIGVERLSNDVADYSFLTAGNKVSMLNILSARYAFDIKNAIYTFSQDQHEIASSLANRWGRSRAFVRAVWRFLEKEHADAIG